MATAVVNTTLLNANVEFTYNGKDRAGKVVFVGVAGTANFYLKVEDANGIVKTFTVTKIENFKVI
jgi:hypothetical protein